LGNFLIWHPSLFSPASNKQVLIVAVAVVVDFVVFAVVGVFVVAILLYPSLMSGVERCCSILEENLPALCHLILLHNAGRHLVGLSRQIHCLVDVSNVPLMQGVS